MTLLTVIFFPVFLGTLTLKVILHGVPLKNRFLFYCSTAFPVGTGLCSLFLFFSYLVFPVQAKMISFTISLIATAVLLKRLAAQGSASPRNLLASLTRFNLRNLKDKNVAAEKLLSLGGLLLFIITLFTVIQFFSLTASTNIFGGWDTRFFWALKARFFFRSPADWRGMFSPKLFWAHPDYPLLIPGILAWGWHWMGQESLLWGPAVSLAFYLSCVFLLVWYLRTYVSSFTGWCAGTFFLTLEPYLFWSVQQYADVPLAFFMTASILILVAALRSEQKRLFLLSGLIGGLAAWTKNEGLFFLVETIFLLGIYCVLKYRRNARSVWNPLIGFAWGALLPLIAIIILKIFLGTTGDYLGSQRTFYDYLRLLFGGWDRTSVILQAFFVYMKPFKMWKGTWVLFTIAASVLGFRKKSATNSYAWTIFLAVLFINLGYLVTLHVTPYNIRFQIQTALDRLLLHSGIVAIAFAFETLSCPFPKNKGQATL